VIHSHTKEGRKMQIIHQIEGGTLEKSMCFDRYDSSNINVHLTFFGGDTLTFHASRESLETLITKLNEELNKKKEEENV